MGQPGVQEWSQCVTVAGSGSLGVVWWLGGPHGGCCVPGSCVGPEYV